MGQREKAGACYWSSIEVLAPAKWEAESWRGAHTYADVTTTV